MKERLRKTFKTIKRIRYFLIFAILLLSINAYAWFVYITRVDAGITAKVRSWNVMFQVHDNNIASEVNFDVGEIYPGMTPFNEYASIVNTGESAGEAYFTIKSVRIFNDTYTDEDYDSDELLDILNNNYPFEIDISLTNTLVEPGHTERFNIDVTWPYESGDDALDTYWGNVAYNYLQTNPNDSCIYIMAEVRVNQESIDENQGNSGGQENDNGGV